MYSTKRAGKQGKRANALLIEKVIYNDLIFDYSSRSIKPL